MRITCPNCSAQFDVPEGAITEEGRNLRCSQCKHKWHQFPVIDEEENILSNEMEDLDDLHETGIDGDSDIPIPLPEELTEPSKRRKINIPWLPVSSVVIMVFAITSGLYWRAEAVKRFPPTAIVYDALGLHVPVKGEDLVLQNIGAWRNNEQFMEILLVQGEIYNPTETIHQIPIIQGTEIDATGRELQSEYFTPEAIALLPNEVIKFEFQKPFPDEKTVTLLVTFSDQERGGDSGY